MNAPLSIAAGIVAFSMACCVAWTVLGGEESRAAVNAGVAIATGNALCALFLARFGASRRSTKAFFLAVFGGMTLRMATTLGGLIVGVKIFFLPAAVFAATLLTFTTLFTAVEVAQWSRQDFSPRVQRS